MTGLMAGKRGLVGLANDKSLAWGIAQQLHAQGAEMAFPYQGEALGKRVKPLAESLGQRFSDRLRRELDMAALDAAFDQIKTRWDTLILWSMLLAFRTRTSCAGNMSTPVSIIF